MAYITINGVKFSVREIEVIQLLRQGKTYKEIGRDVNISPRTVESHVRNAITKAQCRSFDELCALIEQVEPAALTSQVHHHSLRGKFIIAIVTFCVLLGVIYLYNSHCKSKLINISVPSAGYIKRTNCIQKIANIFDNSSIRTIIISGMGGSGKTTLARLFLQTASIDLAWEINADSEDTLFLSFLELAEALTSTDKQSNELSVIKSISNIQEKRRQLLRFIARNIQKHNKWVLLFDNVGNISHIADWIPQPNWANGKLIITTRNKNIVNSIIIQPAIEVAIDALSSQEKYDLFCKFSLSIKKQNAKSHIMKFLQNIPSMPLDVSAVACYLEQTKGSLDDYLKIARENSNDFEKVQSQLMKDTNNYDKTRFGIISSSFIAIAKQNSHFVDLLLFICMLDSQAIPIGLLKQLKESIVVNDFIYNLHKHSLVRSENDKLFLHRSTQDIGLTYLLNNLDKQNERFALFGDAVLSYRTSLSKDADQLIPHIKSFLCKIEQYGSDDIAPYKMKLLTLLGDLYRQESGQLEMAEQCYKRVIERSRCLSSQVKAMLHLKLGDIYSTMGLTNEALIHLNMSLPQLMQPSLEHVQNCRLLGIEHMRQNHFNQANSYFDNAIDELHKIDNYPKDMESDIYADQAFNYFMEGINRNNALKAADMMIKAIDILKAAHGHKSDDAKLSLKLANHTARLAGIYNALGRYKEAMQLADESEQLLKLLPSNSNLLLSPKGVIERERGLASLRLNKIKTANQHFLKAQYFFKKAHNNSYLFKLKNHQIEVLVRLEDLDKAYEICEEVFMLQNREQNNYSDLFYATCYFHAAIIKSLQQNKTVAMQHFHRFFCIMQKLCATILDKESYEALLEQKAFENMSISQNLHHSMLIFENIYWKDYEFIKYYVEPFIKRIINPSKDRTI